MLVPELVALKVDLDRVQQLVPGGLDHLLGLDVGRKCGGREEGLSSTQMDEASPLSSSSEDLSGTSGTCESWKGLDSLPPRSGDVEVDGREILL